MRTKGEEMRAPETTLVVYRAGERVSESELVDLGPPAGLGATVIQGDPRISARTDHVAGPLRAGVFQATPGKALVQFPFTEYATILDGEVELTDEWGNNATLRPGDSYFITQGSAVMWAVRGSAVQKTFLNRVGEKSSPSPMVVYRAGQQVPPSELAELGPPETLGGTVVSGAPALSARLDHRHGALTAGVFQATAGDASIRFPFTEQATVLVGALELTGPDGRTHRLRPGDSYLADQGAVVLWQVSGSPVQKSFFNVVEP